MKKLHRVGVTCGVLSAALVFGVRAGDLEVPIQGLSITEKPTADYEKLIVHGPLSVSGTGVSVKTSVSASIGPDAGDDASVTVSDGAYMASSSNITYGGNGGKGGKITLSGDTMALSWNGRDSGTFGGYVTHTISEYLTSETGIFDLVEMGVKGYFGIKQVYNKNTRVKARLLFNGGYVWNKPAAATLFNADEGAEIVLEGVGTKDVQIYSPYADKTFFTGKGKLTVKGAGSLRYEISNSPEKSTTSFGGNINWENDGGFYILGNNHTVKVTSHDVLPCKVGTVVSVGSGKGWYEGSNATYNKTYLCNILDLNGTTQKVCRLTLGTYAYVTNTSATAATLIFGDKKESEETYPDGVFEANDVLSRISAPRINYKKVGDGTLTLKKIPSLDNFTVEGGKFALTSAAIRFGTLTMAEGTTLVADGCTLNPAVLSENLTLTGVNYESKNGGLIVLSNGDGTVDVFAAAGTISLASVTAPIRNLTISGEGDVTLQGRAGQTIQNLDVGERTVTATAAFEIANLTVPAAGAFVASGVDVKVAAVNAERGTLSGASKGAVVVSRQDGGLDVYVGTPEYVGGRFGGKEVHLIKEVGGELAFVTGCDEASLDVQAGTVRFDASANCNVGALTLADGVTVSVTGGAKLRVDTLSDADAAKITTSDGGLLLRTIDGILYPKYVTVVTAETDIKDATFTRYDAPNGAAAGTYTGIGAVLAECAYATLVKQGTGTLTVTESIQSFTGDFIVKAGVYYTDCAYGIGGVGARTFIKSGATMVSDGTKETLDLHAGGKLYIEGTGAAGMNGVAFEMRSPATKVAVDLRVTSAATYLKYAGNGGITLTGDATITTTKTASDYYTGRMGPVDFGGHTLTVKSVNNYPELTPDGLVVKNPGNIILDDAAFITTGIDASFKTGSADNRIVRKGNYWQIAGANCSAVPWTFEMGSGTSFRFEAVKADKTVATWGGPMVLSGDIKAYKISAEIKEKGIVKGTNYNWLVFTNVVTGTGGIVNNIAATATDLNYMGGGVRLSNPNNSFAGAIKLNRTELDLDASGALPKDGMGAGLRDCTVVLKEGVDYELPGCSIYNTGVITNGTGKWTQPFVKYEAGDLAYKSLVGFSELEVLGGTVTFEASEVEPVKIDTFVATNAALKGEIAFNGRTCELGGLLLDGAALNDAATASFVTDGKVVFAQGAKLTLAGQRKFRSNRAPVTVATAAGGFEGTIEVADPLPGREYRLYVDGTALKLECQRGMLIIVR